MGRQRILGRHEALGVDEAMFKAAVRQLQQAEARSWSVAALAERFDIAPVDLASVLAAIGWSAPLGERQRRTLERLAAGPSPMPQVDGPPNRPNERRDVVAAGQAPVVYVTTSGRSGVWHLTSGCPLLDRGQAAASTMGKQVWPIEAVSQRVAEADGREPCTHCVPDIGAATLLRGATKPKAGQAERPGSPRFKQARTPTHRGDAAQGNLGLTKGDRKRLRDIEASRAAGITVAELRARRRAVAEEAQKAAGLRPPDEKRSMERPSKLYRSAVSGRTAPTTRSGPPGH